MTHSTCQTCGGEGVRTLALHTPPVQVTCDRCGGTGRAGVSMTSTPPKRDPKRIFIGLCLRSGDTRWETAMALIQTVVASAPTGYSFVIQPGGGCDVAHARNLLLHHWQTRTDCGRLVWIDSDIIWSPDDLWRLLAWDVPYVGGLYPLKGIHLRWSWNGRARVSDRAPGLWDVRELCTGFVAMQHRIYEALTIAHPDTQYVIEDAAYRGETGYELCQMGPDFGRRMPEDFMLSRRIHGLGVEVNVDPTILVGHVGALDLLQMHRELGSFKAPELRG